MGGPSGSAGPSDRQGLRIGDGKGKVKNTVPSETITTTTTTTATERPGRGGRIPSLHDWGKGKNTAAVSLK